MRVLITGGAGFIGSNFVRRVYDGTLTGISSITVIDKLTYAGVKANLAMIKPENRYEFVHGDICDVSLVSTLISEIDAVLNFAAESHVDRSINNAAEFVRTNNFGCD